MRLRGAAASWPGPGSTAGARDKEVIFAAVVGELERALTLDDNDADVHRASRRRSPRQIAQRPHPRLCYHQERALAAQPQLRPGGCSAGRVAHLAWAFRREGIANGSGRRCASILTIPSAVLEPSRQGPFLNARQYGEAIEAFMHLSSMDAIQHAFITAAYAWIGDQTAAAAATAHAFGNSTRISRTTPWCRRFTMQGRKTLRT